LELMRGDQTLEAAASQLAGPAGTFGARDPEAMQHCPHDLRAPAHVIAGWVGLLSLVPGEVTRIRVTDVIERNAKPLSEVLAHQPA
jgi:hypothetical protein